MVTTQITRIRNADGSQTLKKHIDGTTLPYSGPNLTAMLSGVTNLIYVLKRIESAPPPVIASATAAIDTLSGASHRL